MPSPTRRTRTAPESVATPVASRPATVWAVLACALLAVLLRWPGLWLPLGPDEAGFTLVARGWYPGSGDLYGSHFVDRSPVLVGVFKVGDLVGGPYLLRFVGAAGMALAVWWTARITQEMAALVDPGRRADRAMVLSALTATALLGNATLDPAAAKGEVLALPLLAGGVLLALRAMRTRRLLLAGLSGVSGMLAVGLKQSLASALVFGAVLFVGAAVAGRVPARSGVRMLAAFAAGAGVVVLGCVLWVLAWGGSPASMFYAVVTFRSDAGHVLSSAGSAAQSARALGLAERVASSGMLLIAVLLTLRAKAVFSHAPVLATALFSAAALDTGGIVLGGSFWPAYLFPLMLSLSWSVGLVAFTPATRFSPKTLQRATGAVTVVLLVACLVTMVSWTRWRMDRPEDDVATGAAIGEASARGDSLVVYGGQATVQWASNLPSPYEHLWSLPMRTMDPELDQLNAVLYGPRAPTWFVTMAPLDAWHGLATEAGVGHALSTRYRLVARTCSGRGIYLRRDTRRPAPRPDCQTPWPHWLWLPPPIG